MKFSALLKSNKLQGWEDFYLQYNKLITYLKNDTCKFKSLLNSEFNKIIGFFNDIENQTDEQRKILYKIISVKLVDKKLIKECHNLQKIDSKLYVDSNITKFNEDFSFGGEESDYENIKILEEIGSPEKKERKKRNILNFDRFKINTFFEKRKKEKAFHELLQAINSVKSYRDINYMGLNNIIKKYVKKKGGDEFSSDFLKKLHLSHFGKSKKIEKMQKDVRLVYKKVFMLDDNLQAQNIFKKIGKKEKLNPFSTFFIGVMLTTLCFLIYFSNFENNQKVKKIAYSVALCQFGGFLFGLCELFFIKYNINYQHIFNFDVISNLSTISFLLNLSITMNFTFLSCLLFIKKIPDILSYALILIPVFTIILPFDILWYKSRLYFISVFIGSFFSGFRKVYFKNFFFADVFQSFTPCFKFIVFGLGVTESCTSNIILNNIWPTIRILQYINRYKETKSKFPHLINMSKYWLVFILGVISPFCNTKNSLINKYKILICFCSSIFSLLWDFFLDWTIFRSKKIFPIYFYTIGSFNNFFSRFAWILKEMGFITEDFFFIILEILRRFLWALFRVENEHVNNCTDNRSKMGVLFSKELFFIKDNDVTKKDEHKEDINTNEIEL